MSEPHIARTEIVSKPGAAIRVERIELTPAGRRALTIGGGVTPAGELLLGIPVEDRPFGDARVIDYYDGPLLMVLASPLQGDFLAMALPDEEGPWPFLLVPATPDQVAAVRGKTRGMRQHILEAERALLMRDYGAHDLVAIPVDLPVSDDWLPSVDA